MAIWTKILVFCLFFFAGTIFALYQRDPTSLMRSGLVLAGNSRQAIDSGYVVINEIAWMGTEISPNDEWIELYNNTEQGINLEGWGLYEAGGEILIESLAGIIESKSYYLIERTDDTTVPDIPASQTPTGWGGHGLKNTGEHLQLKNKDGQVIDEVDCSTGWFAGNNKTKQTMERKNSSLLGNEDSNWQNSQEAGGTPKTKNSSISSQLSEGGPPTVSEQESKTAPTTPPPDSEQLSEVRVPTAPPVYPSGVVINEILPSPEGPDAEEEWIELFNQNNFEVDISGWQVSDIVGRTKIFTFPKATTIKPKGFFVLSRPTTKITLNNSGDGLKLLLPDGTIIDSLNYSKAVQGESFNRSGADWLWSSVLTPAKENIIPETEETEEQAEAKSLLEQTQKEPSDIGRSFINEKQGLAAISESAKQGQALLLAKPLNFLFILLIGIIIALFSGVIILILKKKIEKKRNLS